MILEINPEQEAFLMWFIGIIEGAMEKQTDDARRKYVRKHAAALREKLAGATQPELGAK